MSNWTLNGRTLASLGVTSLRLNRATWSEHALDVVFDGRSVNSPALFSDGAGVTLKYGSTTRFIGEVVATGRAASGPAESHTMRAVNDWLVLEETVYQQPWKILGGDQTKSKARCIVGLKSDYTVGTLAEAIEDVLSYAGVAAGSISLSTTEEPWEVRNVTCAEVLRQIQRMVPRSVSWWSYSGGAARFNVASTASSAVTLAMGLDTDLNLRTNGRQKLRGAVLQYEVVSTTDDEAQTDVQEDTAGQTTGRRVLIQTIPWRGTNQTFARQRTKVMTIPTGTSGDNLKKTRVWWAERVPVLRAALPESGDADQPKLTFNLFDADASVWPEGLPDGTTGYGPASGGKFYFAVKLAQIDGVDGSGAYELTDPEDTGSTKIRLDTSLSRVLLEGTVTPWMEDQNLTAQRWTIYANVSYIDSATGHPKQMVAFANFTATDCQNKEYTSLTSYADGDPVPTGLAADLLSSLSSTQYEGTIAKIEDECSGFAREGQLVRVSGGAAAWASMTAVIQGVQEDISSGLTTLTVGPTPNGAPADMLDLLRRERRRSEADTGMGVTNKGSKEDGLP